jgi:prophage antirepressor-like protein
MSNTDKPKFVSIDGIEYYNAADLKKYDPVYFYGCTKMMRKIITKKNIPRDDYLYATYNIKGKVWNKYEDNVPLKAGLYIKKNWVVDHVTKMKEEKPIPTVVKEIKATPDVVKEIKVTSDVVKEIKATPDVVKKIKVPAVKKIKATPTAVKEKKTKQTIVKKRLSTKKNVTKSMSDEDIPDEKEVINTDDNDSTYREAPDLLILKDDEKFKDDKGNIIEIETRGERTCDGIFFSSPDVAKAFEMPSISKTMTNVNSDYYVDEHFVIFIVPNFQPNSEGDKRPLVVKVIYITYEGMMKILYSSRSPKAKTFRKWATETLFTVQMGTKTKKRDMASKLLGVSVDAVKEVFNTSTTTLPCTYLFTLGEVKNLRKSMNIDKKYTDNMIVCRYGQTDDLAKRTGQHNKTFGKIKGVELNLKYHSYVDPQYNSKAETDIKEYFATLNLGFTFETNTELIIVDPSHFKKIEKQFSFITHEYGGHMKDMIKKVEDLKNLLEMSEKDKALLRKDKELLEKDNKINILEKDKIITEKDKIIMEKDTKLMMMEKNLEIEQLKNQLAKK